jgi:chaperonin GroEL
MGKSVKLGAEARDSMQVGMDILADAVKATLGPKGRHAAIERQYGIPLVTKDGVTVARSISLDDRIQNMGAQLIKSVASATNAVAGDGTTTATILAQSIYSEGAKMVVAGHNPVLIKRGIDKAVSAIVSKLEEISIEVSGSDVIESVATISANNDRELGAMIAEVVTSVGNDGIISVEEGTGTESKITYSEGLSFDRGYISPVFATNTEKLTVEFDNAYVLTYNDKISLTQDFLPILKQVSETGSPLLIVAKDVDSEALQTLVLNKARGSISVCPVKAPGFGDIRADMLGDIATICGGKIITNEDGNALRGVSLTDLGKARRIIVTRNKTTIIDGSGGKDDIDSRVSSVKTQLGSGDLFEHQVASLRQRLSTLSGAVAVFRVGGVTESEMREKKDRVEDSINSVNAAIEQGIVPGGGAALLHCVKSLNALSNDASLSTEERIGVDIVSASIKAPFKQILYNAGVEPYEYMQKIINSRSTVSGYNALTNESVSNMIEAGVIDPVKVVRSALEHAASASGTLLTTEVAIFESDSKES